MFCQNQHANWILPASPLRCLPPFSATDSKIAHLDTTFLCIMASFALLSVLPFFFLLNFVPFSNSSPLYIRVSEALFFLAKPALNPSTCLPAVLALQPSDVYKQRGLSFFPSWLGLQ